jgi:hypothetical protein
MPRPYYRNRRVFPGDAPALSCLKSDLNNCLVRISAIQAVNPLVERERDHAATLLHVRIRKVEKVLAQAMEGAEP